MRAAAAITCLALAACSHQRPAATEVDLNAAAVAAQADIANYAASRHRRPPTHRATSRPGAAIP